jgi:DnaJ-class molecular chaperone
VGAGSGEAAEKFKEISTAYAILSDPNKRRQYDLSGADANSMFESGMESVSGADANSMFESGMESVDLENLNSMMRVFGAMMTKLGVPIPTQVGRAVAAACCLSNGTG